MFTFEKWKNTEDDLKSRLDPERFMHTQGVMYTSSALAMAHGVSVERARIAGLLHDCAKYMRGQVIIDASREAGVEVTEFDEKNPSILHAKLGAKYARTRYGVEDKEILSAIEFHTTGKPEMTKLEQIVYIADFIEPNRDSELSDNSDNYEEFDPSQIRKTAFTNLDECCYLIMHFMVSKLINSGKLMDKTTLLAYNYYKQLHESAE